MLQLRRRLEISERKIVRRWRTYKNRTHLPAAKKNKEAESWNVSLVYPPPLPLPVVTVAPMLAFSDAVGDYPIILVELRLCRP